MSSIVKAIKKRDEVTPPSVANLATPVQKSPPSRRTFVPLLAGVVVGGVLVVGFLAWQEGRGDSIVPIESPTIVPAQVAMSPAQPAPPAPVIEPVAKDPAVVAAPAEIVVVVMNEPEPRSATEEKILTVVTEQAVPLKTALPAVIPKVSPATEPLVVSTEPEPAFTTILPDGVELKVTEIFFQDGAGNSMAIINDLPVMEGTAIETAMVEEIASDHVRFLISGKVYIVKSSLPPAQ